MKKIFYLGYYDTPDNKSEKRNISKNAVEQKPNTFPINGLINKRSINAISFIDILSNNESFLFDKEEQMSKTPKTIINPNTIIR